MELDKIYLGSCYKLIKDIPDKSVDLIYTDIPYIYTTDYRKNNMAFNGMRFGNTSKQINVDTLCNGIDYSVLEDFARVMKKINMYIWCSENQIYDILDKLKKISPKIQYKILIWRKTNAACVNHNQFVPSLEYCLLITEGQGIKSDKPVYKYYESPMNSNDKKLYLHPTIKPLELVISHIKVSTNDNAVVLDPFIGSGTTAVAAKLLNLHYIGFEIDSKYYEIATDRINGIIAKDKMAGIEQLKLF